MEVTMSESRLLKKSKKDCQSRPRTTVVVIFQTFYIHLMPLTFASTHARQAYHLPDLELNRYLEVGIRLQRACIIHKCLVIVSTRLVTCRRSALA